MKIIIASFLLLVSSLAIGQSSPGLVNGQVPTAAQWNSYFANKMDYTLIAPCSGTNNALTYSAGLGFGCNTISGGTSSLPVATTSQLYGGSGTAGTASVVSLGTGLLMSSGTLNATGLAITLPAKIASNPSSSVTGTASGLTLENAVGTESWLSVEPGAGEYFPLLTYASSNNGRALIWGLGAMADVITGNDAEARAAEFRVNNGFANAPDPISGQKVKIGVDIVSDGPYTASAAIWTSSGGTSSNFKHGIWLDGIGGVAGSTLLTATSSDNVDYGIDLSGATINYQGIRVGNTPAAQIAGVAVRQFANGDSAIGVQRFTDTSPTGDLFQAIDAANTTTIYAVDATGKIILPTTNGILWSNGGSGVVPLTIGTGLTLASGTLTATGSGTSGTSILYGNGSGGFSNVTIGSGLSFTGGILSAGGTSGTITLTGSLNYGIDMSTAAIAYQGIRIGATPATQVAGVAVRQFANGTAAIGVQRFTDTSPTGDLLQAIDAADTTTLWAVDATGKMILPTTNGILWSNGNSGVGTVTIGTGLTLSSGTLSATGGGTGTVTSVSGTGTVSGLTLSGTVTTSGSLTLGGALNLTSGNVTSALGYTPYNSSNPSGYISSITGGNVTTALGYTPANRAGDTFTGNVNVPGLILTGAGTPTTTTGQIAFGVSTSATATAGTGALPSAPAGFLNIGANGGLYKIPYYNN